MSMDFYAAKITRHLDLRAGKFYQCWSPAAPKPILKVLEVIDDEFYGKHTVYEDDPRIANMANGNAAEVMRFIGIEREDYAYNVKIKTFIEQAEAALTNLDYVPDLVPNQPITDMLSYVKYRISQLLRIAEEGTKHGATRLVGA